MGRQGSRVSMRVARGSASLLSRHGRGIWPRDVLKKVSRFSKSCLPAFHVIYEGAERLEENPAASAEWYWSWELIDNAKRQHQPLCQPASGRLPGIHRSPEFQRKTAKHRGQGLLVSHVEGPGSTRPRTPLDRRLPVPTSGPPHPGGLHRTELANALLQSISAPL